jgi:activating signal cointegrator 1
MRALTLWQPWAQLVAVAEKKWETRSWWTSHRGELAIHASAAMPKEAREACGAPFIREALEAMGYPLGFELPRGCIVAVVDVKDCIEISPGIPEGLSEQEKAFGIYETGRRAWRLSNVRRLISPVPCAGRQQLWNVSAAIEAQVRAGLEALEEASRRVAADAWEGTMDGFLGASAP